MEDTKLIIQIQTLANGSQRHSGENKRCKYQLFLKERAIGKEFRKVPETNEN